MILRIIGFVLITIVFQISPFISASAPGNVDLPRYPSISPDGDEIIFSWRGDLWKVAASGGKAIHLTNHPEDDLRSTWSQDGEFVAFNSTRDGHLNLYIMNPDGTHIRQISEIDRGCDLVGFGTDSDGESVLSFAASLEGDLYRSPRPYMISTNGGDILRIHDAFGDHPAISPNGEKVLFARGGASWNRRHYKGADSRDIWLFNREDESFKQLTTWEGNDGKAKWGDDQTIYFLSDRQLECVNLYRLNLNEDDPTPVRLTGYRDKDIHDFDLSADGKTAVFLVWDTLYTLKLDASREGPIPLTIQAAEDDEDNYEIKSIDREVSEATLSPDGKVMAYIAYGEVYVRSVEDKSPTQRVTHSHAHEKHIAWAPDGLKLYFVSDRDGSDSIYSATVALTRSDVKAQFDTELLSSEEKESSEEEKPKDGEESAEDEEDEIEEGDKKKEDEEKEGDKKKEKELPKDLDPARWQDAIQFGIQPVVVEKTNDREIRFSLDGKYLSFRRGRGDLMLLNLDTQEVRKLVSGWDTSIDWRWSPDSSMIAYHQNDINFNTDIWIIPVEREGQAVNISQHPNNDYGPRWSADGKILSFISERINNEFDVWMVYLDKTLETLTPKELDEYYKKAAEQAKKRKPLKIEQPKSDDEEDKEIKDESKEDKTSTFEKLDLEDAFLRLKRITRLEGGEYNNEMTPAGDRLIFTGQSGESGLYAIKWDGSDLKRLTNPVSVQHLTLSGDKIVFLDNQQGGTIDVSSGKRETISIDDEIHIDLQKQNRQKFLEAARILGERYYHPTMNGVDWEALTQRYLTLAEQTRTANEFNYVANRLLGELNGSHLGIYARGRGNPNAQSMGRLGTEHKRVENGFKVTDIVPESPAAVGPMALQKGDVITAIDSKSFGSADTIESMLEGKIGKEVLLTIQRTNEKDEPKTIQVLITPISWGNESNLKYKAWRLNKAKLVDEWSDGALGYIHIRAMNQSSLDVYERDLYAAAHGKKGLIIDVRNNGGGWTTDRVLASIMAERHAYTIPRGADPDIKTGYPQDRLFIQRYTLPINMLCNEKSFSNAEIVSHAFKTLERGTLVGQETNGSVISTGGTSLIDGTYMRLPFRGWYVLDDTDMEEQGAIPHLIVPQTPEAESLNKDEQLKAAIDDLLKRID